MRASDRPSKLKTVRVPDRRRAVKSPGGDRPLPAHALIEEHLRELILAGEGQTEPLPTEETLASKFNVNRMTVRQAYQRLAAAGVVSRRRGVGSFVNPQAVESLPLFGKEGFEAWLDDRGTTSRHVLRYELVPCPAAVAPLMRLEAGAPVTYLERLRIIKGVGFFDKRYMNAWVIDKISAEEIERSSLLLLLLDAGFNPASVRVDIDAHPAAKDESGILGIPIGAPVLERRITYVDKSGTALFFGRTHCPGQLSAYSFSTELTPELKKRLLRVKAANSK
jgi:GntR family transcriptional regulator